MLLTTYHLLGSHAPLLCHAGLCDEAHTARGAELTGLHRSHSCWGRPSPQDVRRSPWPSGPAAPASPRSPRCQHNSQCKHMPQDSHQGSPGTNSQMEERKHSPHSPEEQRRKARTPAIWLHGPYTWPSQLRQYSPAQYTETRKGQSTSPRGTGTLTPDLRARVTATLHPCKTESSGPTRWDGVLL